MEMLNALPGRINLSGIYTGFNVQWNRRKVDVDMLDAVKSVLADVLSGV